MKKLSISAVAIGLILQLGVPVSAVSSAPINLTNDGGLKYETEVAASDEWIAYERILYPENTRQIVAENIKSHEVRLIDDSQYSYSRNINVSDNIITYETQEGEFTKVRVYDLKSGITKTIPGNYYMFESDTDGINVSFIGFKDSKRDLFVYNIQNGTTVQLTNDDTQESYSSISGDNIALAKYINGRREVFVYNLPTNIFSQITTSTEDVFWPKISGSNIVWNTNSSVFVSKLGENSETKLYDGKFNDPYFAYPTNTNIYRDGVVFTVTESVDFTAKQSLYVYDFKKGTNIKKVQSDWNLYAAINKKGIIYVDGTYPADRDIYFSDF